MTLRSPAAAALLLGLALLAIHLPAAGFELPLTGGEEAVALSPGAGGRAPLASLSLSADRLLFGPRPFGPHLAGVLLFALASGLLLLVLHRMTGDLPLSAGAAALFALHPMRAESVAWVGARGDGLGLLFAVLALAAWLRTVREGDPRWGWATAAFLAMGILATPALLPFPLLLLALDLWPLRRVSVPLEDLLAEKAPLFAVSVLLSLLSLRGVGGGDPLGRLPEALSLPFRLLADTFLPLNLGLADPSSSVAPGAAVLLLSAGALAGISWTCVRLGRRFPWLGAGWGWTLAALLPFAFAVDIDPAVLPADRFSLLAHVGLALALGGAGRELLPRLFSPRGLTALLAAVLATLGVLSAVQSRTWQDDQTLLTRVLEVNPEPMGFYPAFTGAADRLVAQAGDTAPGVGEEARLRLDDWERTLRRLTRLRTDRFTPRVFLAYLLGKRGRLDKADVEYEQLLLRKDLPQATRALVHAERARVLDRLHRPADAESHLRDSLALDPGQGEVRFALALLLNRQGRNREAIAQLREVVELLPDSLEGRVNLAELLFLSGEKIEARGQFGWVSSKVPGSAEAAFAEGRVREMEGDLEGARESYRRAVGLPAASTLDLKGHLARPGAETPIRGKAPASPSSPPPPP